MLNIKNMVCPRCIRVVKEDLEKIGVKVKAVTLGQADIVYNEASLSMGRIEQVLNEAGFELLEDRDQKLIEQIKLEIINLLNNPEGNRLTVNNSEYLSRKTGVNYGYLSRLFSQHMGITIEKYFIQQKIAKAKEMLKYEDRSSEDIAWMLGYSSLAHLSKQFKDVTGMTITAFKKENSRK